LNPIELMRDKTKRTRAGTKRRAGHARLIAAVNTALDSTAAQDAGNWLCHYGHSFT
jgi:hypothetical protein